MIGAFFNPLLAGGGTASMDVDFIASTQSGPVGTGITFSNLSSPTPIFNFWNFGDGSFSTASDPLKTYPAGIFTVTLNAVDNVSGGIETKIDYINISRNIVLDEYPGATISVSTSLLRSAYTGDCMIVRRSSDNATQSIGFTQSQLDTAALSTFIGANSGFVQTWFDQSGNGNDFLSFTASWQPRIVNSGTLETMNGRPAPRFLGIDTLMHLSKVLVQPFTTFSVSKLTAATGIFASVIFDSLLTTGDRSIVYHSGSTENPANQFRYGSITLATIEASRVDTLLVSTLHNGASSIARTKGVQRHTGNIGTQGANGLTLGGLRGMNTVLNAYAFSGHIGDLIIYANNQSSNFSGIEGVINQYWGGLL
jgi:PKD repeat protein